MSLLSLNSNGKHIRSIPPTTVVEIMSSVKFIVSKINALKIIKPLIGKIKNNPVIRPGAYFLKMIVATICGAKTFTIIAERNPK